MLGFAAASGEAVRCVVIFVAKSFELALFLLLNWKGVGDGVEKALTLILVTINNICFWAYLSL